MTDPLPRGVRTIPRRGGDSSEHDRGRRRSDHRRAQRGRIATRLRCPHRSRPHRPDNRRDDQAARRAGRNGQQRPPPVDRGHPNPPHPHTYARHAPHPNPRHTNPRHPTPRHTNPRPPSPPRSTGWPPHLGPLDRVMDRCRRLAPEVIRSHRARNEAGEIGSIGDDRRLRRPRPEWNELLARPEPVPREVDDVRRPVVVLLASLVVGSVVFHRFADLFPVGRGIRVLPAG
jgi:hypothetical protein